MFWVETTQGITVDVCHTLKAAYHSAEHSGPGARFGQAACLVFTFGSKGERIYH